MIWKEIEGYSNYLISKDVVNFANNHYQPLIINKYGKILKYGIKSNGYYCTCLYKNGKRKDFSVHRLYAKAYIPNPLNKPFIDHINRIRTDNRLENLRWVTRSENSRNTKKWGYIIKVQRHNRYQAQWQAKPNITKTKSFKTYEEAKAFLDCKEYDINGNEIIMC